MKIANADQPVSFFLRAVSLHTNKNAKEARNKYNEIGNANCQTRLRHAGSKDHKDQIVDGSTKGIQKARKTKLRQKIFITS